MMPACVFLPGYAMNWPIPPEDNRSNYSPKSFSGSCQVLRARLMTPQEIHTRRNLALNPYDTHGEHGLFPHAEANVETRNEAVFAARNAIDGLFMNHSHGTWPYQSWGVNRNPNAALTLSFGRTVVIDELRLTLRADFPMTAGGRRHPWSFPMEAGRSWLFKSWRRRRRLPSSPGRWNGSF